MAVWASELQPSIKTNNGETFNIKTAILETTTDSSGNATFDISSLGAVEILSNEAQVEGLAGVTDTVLVSESLTEIVHAGKKENVVTITLGLLFEPFISVGAGVTMKLRLTYR